MMKCDQKHYQKLMVLAICIFGGVSACATNQGNPAATSTAANTNTPKISIIVTDKGCEPLELSAPVGKSTFVITNRSSQVLEWEILQNGMVIEEKENIVPGFVQDLKADLKAGTYEMACGLRSNPKGKINVAAQ